MNIIDNDLLSVQEARILAENAGEAQIALADFSQARLDSIVECMADEIADKAYELAVMSYEETDYGRLEDKCLKNKFASEFLKNELKGMKCVGIIEEDAEKSTWDVGVPRGMIVSVVPSTSPVSTTIYNTLISIKSGNAIVFSPNVRAKNSVACTLDTLIKIGEKCGLPEGVISYMTTVTKAGTVELMNHSSCGLILITGVPGILEEAYKTKKPVIYGGTGNGPAFIERTANIGQAAKDIVESKSFDYGIVPSAEQSIVVESCIFDRVKSALIAEGCYFMTPEEADNLGKLFYNGDGTPNLEMIGKSPQILAKRAGFNIGEHIKLLIAEEKYVSIYNPYSKEKLGPVLSLYIEEDWRHACEKCIELLVTEKNGHTITVHSNDLEVIRQFALKKPVGRVLVNTPAAFGSIGCTTNLFPALTLGSGSAGRGMTADNVSPMNLVYIRKVGFGVRDFYSAMGKAPDPHRNICHETRPGEEISGSEGMKQLYKLLKDTLKEQK